ncbi:hypothetical protein SAM23877_6993 [Streptomyces ambofaciens ATCC 23877]|uniref:Uncharacterized protein n=2 Tax=Streptomyces ambofaciens TaxID=1889 RepID=A0A0K2B493_STRA7|nr:hypothetical protein [Streptomyces ambofaciens]AKZ60038.1 hypothetical protein SAM23877_6993 [Streptomyces ambofaciens ATCC 23877]ANB10262.1 hypothetical protein SAM40697_6309 [Streptomyces ambofaciens]
MPLTVVHAQTAPTRATGRRGSRPGGPLSPAEADVLRIVADPRTPVFVTVREGGRRRYSYWRPLDSATGRGGCYAALPTAECDKLHAAGRIALGEPLTDPARTIYRVKAIRTPAGSVRAVRDGAYAA